MRGRHRHDLDKVERVKDLVGRGMTYAEVGLSVGLSRGAVAGIMHRYKDTEIIDLSNINNMPIEDRNRVLQETVSKITERANESSNA